MGEIVNTFLMVADKSIPEMHFKLPEFTYSACGPFTKNKEGIGKVMQIGNRSFNYKNKYDEAR